MKTTGWNRFLAFFLSLSLLLNVFVVLPLTTFAEDQPQEIPTTNDNLSDEQKHAYEPFKSIKEYQYAEDADQIDEASLLLKIATDTAPALSPIPEELAALGVAGGNLGQSGMLPFLYNRKENDGLLSLLPLILGKE